MDLTAYILQHTSIGLYTVTPILIFPLRYPPPCMRQNSEFSGTFCSSIASCRPRIKLLHANHYYHTCFRCFPVRAACLCRYCVREGFCTAYSAVQVEGGSSTFVQRRYLHQFLQRGRIRIQHKGLPSLRQRGPQATSSAEHLIDFSLWTSNE